MSMGNNHVRLVLSTTLRRSIRRLTADRRRLLLLVASFLVTTPVWYRGTRLVYRYGRRWVTGEPPIPLPDLLGNQLSFLAILIVGLTVLRTALEIGYPDEPAFVLLATPAPDVATGLVLAECVRVVFVLGVPITAVWTVFAFGMGAPLLVVTGGISVALFLLACVLGGYLLGLGVTPVVRRIGHRVLYGLLAVVLAVVIAGLERTPSPLASFPEAVRSLEAIQTPLSVYTNLALLGSPAVSTASPVGSILSIATAVALPLCLLGAVRTVAPAVWWRSSQRSAGAKPTRAAATGHVPFKSHPSVRVARIQILRGVRNPAGLAHVFVAAFVLLPTGVSLLGEPLPVALLVGPPIVSVATVWVAGALFCLNPIGDSGPMYSQLVLATVPDRCFVDGRMLAGLVITLPPATILLAVAGIVGPITIPQTAILTGVTVLSAICATAVGSGLGCLVPATHRSTRADGRTVVTPHLTVLGLYSFLVGAGGLVGLLLVFLPEAFTIVVPSVPADTIQTWGGLALLTSCTAISILSYRYATVRFVRYELY